MKRETSKDIEDYIERCPGDVQRLLTQMRSTVKKAAPEATEKISYGIPTFALAGNLVHFAASKNHIGFYPTPSAIKAFGKELVAYKCSKGAVQFPLGEPLPLALVSRMVKFRVKENLAKGK
ncbi:MAG: iron chaperone [Terriglobales bacterium]